MEQTESLQKQIRDEIRRIEGKTDSYNSETATFLPHPSQLLARRYKPQRHHLVDEFIAERRDSVKYESL